jgi:hypothetical protein
MYINTEKRLGGRLDIVLEGGDLVNFDAVILPLRLSLPLHRRRRVVGCGRCLWVILMGVAVKEKVVVLVVIVVVPLPSTSTIIAATSKC